MQQQQCTLVWMKNTRENNGTQKEAMALCCKYRFFRRLRPWKCCEIFLQNIQNKFVWFVWVLQTVGFFFILVSLRKIPGKLFFLAFNLKGVIFKIGFFIVGLNNKESRKIAYVSYIIRNILASNYLHIISFYLYVACKRNYVSWSLVFRYGSVIRI